MIVRRVNLYPLFVFFCVLILLSMYEISYAQTATSPSTEIKPLQRTHEKIATNQELRIVLWGDSISEVGRSERWNGGATSQAKHWGAVLIRELQHHFPNVKYTLIHAGIGGQNSYEGLGRLDELTRLKPDLVIVAFGANDCCYHFLQPDQTFCAMNEMLARISLYSDVLCIGTAGSNPRDEKFLHTDETIAATARAAQMQHVQFIDMRKTMLIATNDDNDWGKFHLSPMNCHPNDAGHEIWGTTIAKALINVLLMQNP